MYVLIEMEIFFFIPLLFGANKIQLGPYHYILCFFFEIPLKLDLKNI